MAKKQKSVETRQLGCVEFSEELLRVITIARGEMPKSSWLEQELWKLPSIKRAAKESNITKPERPMDRRGRHARTTC